MNRPGKTWRRTRWDWRSIGILLLSLTLILLALDANANESDRERATAHICTTDASACSVEMSRLWWSLKGGAGEKATNAYLGVVGDPALDTFSRPDGPLLLVPAGSKRIPYHVYEHVVDLGVKGVIAVGAVHPNILEEASLKPSALKAKWDREDAERKSACNHPFGCPYEGTIAQRIARCESHENPNAKNPRSTASGIYQFLDGTIRSLGYPAPARALPWPTQTEAFWKLWDGGKGASHWNASRSCWGKYWSG